MFPETALRLVEVRNISRKEPPGTDQVVAVGVLGDQRPVDGDAVLRRRRRIGAVVAGGLALLGRRPLGQRGVRGRKDQDGEDADEKEKEGKESFG